MKRIKRKNNRREEREAQLLGLKETPKPRVRIANMMRVYGTEANARSDIIGNNGKKRNERKRNETS